MNKLIPQAPAFAWRVYIKAVGYQYYTFYRIPYVPLQGDSFRLVKRDAITENSEVGIYTRAQYENRVSNVIGRTDCEVL